MIVRKSEEFIADVERQFGWYVVNAGWEVADRCLDTLEATCHLLGKHPLLGALGGFARPRLRAWRFFTVFKPFNQHLVFYEVLTDELILRRAMHGQRDLPRRLLEPPL